MSNPVPLSRRCVAEALGTAALLAIVVGSGIMGERLATGNDALALLANALATGAGLFVLISVLSPLSGAHFNPLVTLLEAWLGKLGARELACYLPAQIAGAVAGVVLAHLMFDLAPLVASAKPRTGPGQWLSESVASAGLLLTIVLGVRHRVTAVPALVSAYIFAAYWFTASTAFANPAVTLARALTPTFAGIAPGDVAGFLVAQGLGAVLALVLLRALLGREWAPAPSGHPMS